MRLQFRELNITPRVVARLHDLDFTVPKLEDAIAEPPSLTQGLFRKGKAPLSYIAHFKIFS